MLSENHAMLKGINVNKMNHQYIQNLQKANMTLKCKIKEISELAGGAAPATTSQENDDGHWFDLEAAEEELVLKELGTIEQISEERLLAKKERMRQKSQARELHQRERAFYDKGRMGGPRKGGIVAGLQKKRNGAHVQHADKQATRDSRHPEPREDRESRKKGYGIWNTQTQSDYDYAQEVGPYDYYADYYDHYGYYDGYYTYYGYYDPYYYYDHAPPKKHYLDRAYDEQKPQVAPRHAKLNKKKSERHPKKPAANQVVRPAGESDEEVPAEKPGVASAQSKEARDMRPAVFIKDLSARSVALEEEKAARRSKKEQIANKLTETPATSEAVLAMQDRLAKAKDVLKSEDQAKVANLIYTHKMQADEPSAEPSSHKLSALKSELDALISQAEAKLLSA